jgi:hypothetical protein
MPRERGYEMANNARFTVDGKTIEVSHVPVKSSFEDFIMLNQQYFIAQAQNPKSPIYFRLRDLIVGRTDRQNFVQNMTPSSLALFLGVSKSSTSRALFTLVQEGFLVKEGRSFFLNPSIGWKGSQSDHKTALRVIK